jgi:hypothetical protein
MTEVLEKVWLKALGLSEKFNIFRRERKSLQKTRDLLKPCRYQEPTVWRQLANEQTERCWCEHTVLKIARRHRQLVKICEQGKVLLWRHHLYARATLVPG